MTIFNLDEVKERLLNAIFAECRSIEKPNTGCAMPEGLRHAYNAGKQDGEYAFAQKILEIYRKRT